MQTDYIIVRGSQRLTGTVTAKGAKNSVLKLMAASLLASGTTTLTNVPNISDVGIMREVLESLGAEVAFGNGELSIDTTSVTSFETSYELVKKMRASIAVLGPLIGRFGQARVAQPGGCQIGSRKLDMHFAGLESLGVEFKASHGYINASIGAGGLKAAEVGLEFPSVGATENLMVAATCAKGTTVIHNAAREPEIVDLADFLCAMGARISGQGSPSITVEGVDEFVPVQGYNTVGDRIEAGTFLVAAALTGGPVTVEGIDPGHLVVPIRKLREFGCEVSCGANSVSASRDVSAPIVPTDIQTLPYPGFPTDLQPQFMVLSALADGTSVITENVFENRFMFADELNRMGADVRIDGHHAIVQGIAQLSGAPVQAPDLRAGAGLLLAGLVADGETIISEIGHIDRGYEDIVPRLAALGANISRVPAP
jgi:UDP-N-acetylglucosamine 1-carboxyvinyltransferase